MAQPFTQFHAIALPMLVDNIDTDQLSPSWSFTARADGYGFALLGNQRYFDNIGLTPDPSFILNQEPYRRASILVAGANFGCGSSRETAVWALRDSGFRAVIAVSFNETFKRNCIVNGFAPLTVERHVAERLTQAILADPYRGLSVDLEQQRVWAGADQPGQDAEGSSFAVSLDPFYRSLLLSGHTEDELLGTLQVSIDQRRNELLDECPWLRWQSAADISEAGGKLHSIEAAG